METGGGHSPSFIPFFSRRIGLYENEQVPVDWGVKVYGKIGQTNIALLDVKTRAFNGIPSGNFAAGRIYRNIFSESKLGLIFTHGEPGSNQRNTLLGIDFRYASSRFLHRKNVAASGWWVNNWNSRTEGKHYGYGFKIDYPNDLIDSNLSYNYFGDALEPGLGFLPRSGVRNLQGRFSLGPRPRKGFLGKLIRKFSWEMYPNIYWDLSGRLESSRVSLAPFTVFNLESGDRLEFFLIFHREVLPEPLEVADNVIIPRADYRYKRYQFNFWSASHRPASVRVEYEVGGFYGGTLSRLELGVGFNSRGNIKLGLEGDFIRGSLPEGRFKETLYRGRADFYLNPDLGLMTFLQYDSVSENLGVNIRFKWRISPGNTIYLVYNKAWERELDPLSAARRFFSLQDRGIFKIQLSWRP